MQVLPSERRMARPTNSPGRILPNLSQITVLSGISLLFLPCPIVRAQSGPTKSMDVIASEEQTTADRELTLDQAIDQALEHNGEIVNAKLDVQNFEALKAKARAQYLPKVTNNSDASYLTAREGVVLPAGSLGVFSGAGEIPSKTLHIDQGGNLTYASRTFLSQPTLQLFAVHAANRAAKADVQTAKLNVEDKSEDIAVQVRQLYYQILNAEAQLRAAVQESATFQKSDDEAKSQVREGSALPLKELEARANLLQAESNVLKARTAERGARRELNNVMGTPLDARFRLVDAEPLGPGGGALPSREEAIRLSLAKQPQIIIAEQKVEKAKAELRVAEDAFIPEVTVNAHQSYQVGIALLVRNYGVFEGEFRYELFDGGARRAQVRSQRSLLAQAQQNLANVRTSNTVAIGNAYDTVESNELDLKAKQQATVARAEEARVADSRYVHGELLASERAATHAQLAEAEASERQAALNLALSRSQVRKLLGEIPR